MSADLLLEATIVCIVCILIGMAVPLIAMHFDKPKSGSKGVE